MESKMSPCPSTDRLREIRDRTDESCPFLFTLLGMVAVAEGVLRAADGSQSEVDREEGNESSHTDGTLVALGAVALAQRLVASCLASARSERFTDMAAPDASSPAVRPEDVWYEALI
jgi:hypothetical protein